MCQPIHISVVFFLDLNSYKRSQVLWLVCNCSSSLGNARHSGSERDVTNQLSAQRQLLLHTLHLT